MSVSLSRAQIDAKARALIKSHEGIRLKPYIDTVGKCTIGVGRNLTDRGLSEDEVTLLFENDMKIANHILDNWVPSWRSYPAPAQMGLLSMAFNLGGPRLLGFKKMRAALLAGDFTDAAKEALHSKWAEQTGARADEIAAMLREAEDADSADGADDAD